MREKAFRGCQAKSASYGNEWKHGIISSHAVIYTCGMIGRADEKLVHAHEEDELDLCRELSQKAAFLMDGISMCNSDGDHVFSPFYIAANHNIDPPLEITESFIRKSFGGTLHPNSSIRIQPLEEKGEWWNIVSECEWENEDRLDAWKSLIYWFQNNNSLKSPVFIRIDIGGEYRDSESGCVFPRMAVGLTEHGSIAGIFSAVVHS